jgi:hypothetical protein
MRGGWAMTVLSPETIAKLEQHGGGAAPAATTARVQCWYCGKPGPEQDGNMRRFVCLDCIAPLGSAKRAMVGR